MRPYPAQRCLYPAICSVWDTGIAARRRFWRNLFSFARFGIRPTVGSGRINEFALATSRDGLNHSWRSRTVTLHRPSGTAVRFGTTGSMDILSAFAKLTMPERRDQCSLLWIAGAAAQFQRALA